MGIRYTKFYLRIVVILTIIFSLISYTSGWLISTSQGNLTGDTNSCYNNSLGDCFAINWSLAYNQINWSDNYTIHSGNYSWNFTEYDIKPIDNFIFNFTNNGTTNITIKIKLNTSSSKWNVFCEGSAIYGGLVSYYKFDANNAIDNSDNSYDGIVDGATWNSTGGLNDSGAFEYRVDDFIDLGDQGEYFNGTIALWVKKI